MADVPIPEGMAHMQHYTNYLKYKGVWDMQDLYESMADFLRQQKFRLREVVYKHKRPSPFGVDRQYVWEATKEVEDYYRFHLDIFFHTYDARDIEVTMRDGAKKLYTKGRFWVQIRGAIVSDPDKRWEDRLFFAKLRNYYHKYVIQKKMEGVWGDDLHYNILEPLHHLIQERLKMESEEYEHREFTGAH
ncbi:hypothetical protein J4212_01340 [Candidatus Woesearchaeota archaeon]|nr:hypothetical protein [Candidatus Woesearchaeota archaeon]